jgi:glutathione S-transferase
VAARRPSLFVVPGSHPCACVERALELKGIAYRRVELPPPLHAPIQRAIFGRRTVPGLRLAGGERVSGSRAILRRLEELAPEPRLLPGDADARARVEEAERWGDEVLQPLVRRVLWSALSCRPEAIPSFSEGSSLNLPAQAVAAFAPALTRAQRMLNAVSDDAVRKDLETLPSHLDRVDAWIADGTLGGEAPNVADLQIAPSIRLLSNVADLRTHLESRPCLELATRLFPTYPGAVPAGALAVG